MVLVPWERDICRLILFASIFLSMNKLHLIRSAAQLVVYIILTSTTLRVHRCTAYSFEYYYKIFLLLTQRFPCQQVYLTISIQCVQSVNRAIYFYLVIKYIYHRRPKGILSPLSDVGCLMYSRHITSKYLFSKYNAATHLLITPAWLYVA